MGKLLVPDELWQRIDWSRAALDSASVPAKRGVQRLDRTQPIAGKRAANITSSWMGTESRSRSTWRRRSSRLGPVRALAGQGAVDRATSGTPPQTSQEAPCGQGLRPSPMPTRLPSARHRPSDCTPRSWVVGTTWSLSLGRGTRLRLAPSLSASARTV